MQSRRSARLNWPDIAFYGLTLGVVGLVVVFLLYISGYIHFGGLPTGQERTVGSRTECIAEVRQRLQDLAASPRGSVSDQASLRDLLLTERACIQNNNDALWQALQPFANWTADLQAVLDNPNVQDLLRRPASRDVRKPAEPAPSASTPLPGSKIVPPAPGRAPTTTPSSPTALPAAPPPPRTARVDAAPSASFVDLAANVDALANTQEQQTQMLAALAMQRNQLPEYGPWLMTFAVLSSLALLGLAFERWRAWIRERQLGRHLQMRLAAYLDQDENMLIPKLIGDSKLILMLYLYEVSRMALHPFGPDKGWLATRLDQAVQGISDTSNSVTELTRVIARLEKAEGGPVTANSAPGADSDLKAVDRRRAPAAPAPAQDRGPAFRKQETMLRDYTELVKQGFEQDALRTFTRRWTPTAVSRHNQGVKVERTAPVEEAMMWLLEPDIVVLGPRAYSRDAQEGGNALLLQELHFTFEFEQNGRGTVMKMPAFVTRLPNQEPSILAIRHPGNVTT